MDITKIKFEERYDDKEFGITNLYFIAPKEMLQNKYPEAEHMEICIELPTAFFDAEHASVQFSPTKYNEIERSYVDYDWFDAEITIQQIEELLRLAESAAA